MKLFVKTFAVWFLTCGSLLTSSVFAQEGEAGNTPESTTGESGSATTPAPEPPLRVKLLVGNERFLFPGAELGKVRVAIALMMGENAPNFSQDMLSSKALSWVDPEGKAHPIEEGEVVAGAAPLPKGTFLRNLVEVPPPSFPIDQGNFSLRWSFPGVDPVDVEFLRPRPVAESEALDLRTLSAEQIDRSLVRIHFAKIGADGETRQPEGSLLFRLEAPSSVLNQKAMREWLFHAIESNYYDGMPIYSLDPDLALQTGQRLPIRRTDPYPKVGQHGLEAVQGAEYAPGDLVLVATPWAAGNSPTISKNLWRGQMMVPFTAIRPKPDSGPLSVRIGRLLQGEETLTQLKSVDTVTDVVTGLEQPQELLVVDRIEYLSF